MIETPDLMSDGSSQMQTSLKTTAKYSLHSHNVRIAGRRTSVRLEPQMWEALNEIAGIEKCSVHDLCTAVHDLKESQVSFTASLRVFLMEYYRMASKASAKVADIKTRIKTAQLQKNTA